MSRFAENKTSLNPMMDAEHRVQIGLLDALCEAIDDGRDVTVVGEILVQFVDYTKEHFRSEEMLMRLDGYDGLDPHVEDHGEMLKVLHTMMLEYQAGNTKLLPGRAKALLSFLLRHIETRDARYASWIPS